MSTQRSSAVWRGRSVPISAHARRSSTAAGSKHCVARSAVAELTETVEVNGAPKVTPEALVFELTDDGLIGRVRIYNQDLGPA